MNTNAIFEETPLPMKAILVSLTLILSVLLVQGQQVAQDFTKADCAGQNHNLFSELDSGYAVILDYVMIGSCYSCINATSKLQTVAAGYAATYPGRVKLYTIGYNNNYTCSQLENWEQTNNLTPTATFTQGSSDVSYYGGMGMPTIVVAGGVGKNVFYKKLGFSDGDTVAIKDAINKILTTTSVSEKVKSPSPILTPNPARGATKIIWPGVFPATYTLSDMTGKRVATGTIAPQDRQAFALNTENLQPGLYFIRLQSDGETYTLKLILN